MHIWNIVRTHESRVWGEYLIPLFNEFDLLKTVKHEPSVPDSEVTPQYLAEHMWLIGSPDTVEQKLRHLYDMAGGFGTLLIMIVDSMDDQAGWENSMRLLAKDVMPRLADLVPD